MRIIELPIEGVFEINPTPHVDFRGFFVRTYDVDIFRKHRIHMNWLQENHSRSDKMGTIRGLHLQMEPFSETKLVRCIRGAVYDVAVDLRKNSPSFGNVIEVELSEENMKMLYIPRGFAHGYCTLTDISEVLYKVDNYYSPEHEVGILWNDMDLNIRWPVKHNPIISEKDMKNITLKEFILRFYNNHMPLFKSDK
jgi:dTDP-4-dehydrorhamnose 3,5-epimerase